MPAPCSCECVMVSMGPGSPCSCERRESTTDPDFTMMTGASDSEGHGRGPRAILLTWTNAIGTSHAAAPGEGRAHARNLSRSAARAGRCHRGLRAVPCGVCRHTNGASRLAGAHPLSHPAGPPGTGLRQRPLRTRDRSAGRDVAAAPGGAAARAVHQPLPRRERADCRAGGTMARRADARRPSAEPVHDGAQLRDLRVRAAAIEVNIVARGLEKAASTIDRLEPDARGGEQGPRANALWDIGLLGNRGIEPARAARDPAGVLCRTTT